MEALLCFRLVISNTANFREMFEIECHKSQFYNFSLLWNIMLRDFHICTILWNDIYN